jgi:hypothetical protein
MKASEIARSHGRAHRRVYVDVPEPRSAVGLAVGMLPLGVDVEVRGRRLELEVGPVFAGAAAMFLERFTGIRAVNEWETP